MEGRLGLILVLLVSVNRLRRSSRCSSRCSDYTDLVDHPAEFSGPLLNSLDHFRLESLDQLMRWLVGC